jgi:hypothetical protein
LGKGHSKRFLFADVCNKKTNAVRGFPFDALLFQLVFATKRCLAETSCQYHN